MLNPNLSLRAAFAGFLILAGALAPARAQNWERTLSPQVPGAFPELRPMHARYGFGWNTLTAGEADFRFSKTSDGRLQLDATGRTVGFVRKLWSYAVTHVAWTDAHTLRPIEVRETEVMRTKKFVTDVNYSPQNAVSKREEQRAGQAKSKTRQFDLPNVQSIDSALLFLRTQSFKADAPQRFVVYPSTTAYFCTLTPLGREQITVPTGSYQAIKLDLQLNKVGGNHELMPHKKFRHATVWLSDDPNRLVLRIEVQIFAGTVFAELQSLQFDDGKP